MRWRLWWWRRRWWRRRWRTALLEFAVLCHIARREHSVRGLLSNVPVGSARSLKVGILMLGRRVVEDAARDERRRLGEAARGSCEVLLPRRRLIAASQTERLSRPTRPALTRLALLGAHADALGDLHDLGSGRRRRKVLAQHVLRVRYSRNEGADEAAKGTLGQRLLFAHGDG